MSKVLTISAVAVLIVQCWACSETSPLATPDSEPRLIEAAPIDIEATEEFVDEIMNTKALGIKHDSRERIVKIQLPSFDLDHQDFLAIGGLPFIHTLLLGNTAFSDQDSPCLLNLPHLRKLGLKSTQITDQSMPVFAQLPAIRELYLADNDIGNSGIAALEGKSGLELIGLRGTHVDTGAVESLARIPNLLTLVIDEGQISPDGIERLEKALPLLDIRLRTPATPEEQSSDEETD